MILHFLGQQFTRQIIQIKISFTGRMLRIANVKWHHQRLIWKEPIWNLAHLFYHIIQLVGNRLVVDLCRQITKPLLWHPKVIVPIHISSQFMLYLFTIIILKLENICFQSLSKSNTPKIIWINSSLGHLPRPFSLPFPKKLVTTTTVKPNDRGKS